MQESPPNENSKQLTTTEQAIAKLPSREFDAYSYFCRTHTSPIAPSTQAQMFNLYLQGTDCEGIRKFTNGFTLGQIVAAKVIGQWDLRRQEHTDTLLNGVRARVQQIGLESIVFISDALAATHKHHGEKFKKYLLTGNEEDLGDAPVGYSIKQYKDLLEMLMKATGMDKDKESTVNNYTMVQSPVSSPVYDAKVGPAKATDAARFLEELADENE